MPHTPESVMTALGYSVEESQLYEGLLAWNSLPVADAAQALDLDPDRLRAMAERLIDHGIVSLDRGVVLLVQPGAAIAIALRQASGAAANAQRLMEHVLRAVPFLASTQLRPHESMVHGTEPIDGEITSGGTPIELLRVMIRETQGDMLWLRPDQFREPREDIMATIVAEAMATGRVSRAIYPAHALVTAPATLRYRAERGEQVRTLPDVPTRMIILGATHVVLPEPIGMRDEPRSLLRQRGVVQAMTLLFEELWARAVPWSPDGDVLDDQRRHILSELASGSQDEQIARRVGLSLRTVRRRIADLMAELGADSRFAAGVEAARRGWI